MNDLAHILGVIDACFAPVREYGPGSRLSANAAVARDEYADQGIEWHGGGGSASERKNVERRLSELHEAGAVELFRRRGRTARVKLTPDGEQEARMACGLPCMGSAMLRVLEIAELQSREPEAMEELWIPETKLAGVEWGHGDTKPLVAVEDDLLPALVPGLVQFGTTVRGHCYYAITPAGWVAVDEGYPLVPVDDRERDRSGPPAHGFYLDAFKAARARMQDADVSRVGEIGPMPLPVSMHGIRLNHARARA